MKNIIKKFPLTVYTIAFFFSFFLFSLLKPDMSLSNFVTSFWKVLLIIFFPMVVAVKNGNIFVVVMYAISFDIFIFRFCKYLVTKIKRNSDK